MQIRVYYEDTDAAGVVYHSNYLNYCERARTEYLRERGYSVAELAASGTVFPVARMEIDFKAPARHDDLLRIVTVPLRVGGHRSPCASRCCGNRTTVCWLSCWLHWPVSPPP